MDRGMSKVVIVRRRTRYEELRRRYNTAEQARFYIEHLGADFSDYELEDRNYREALEKVREAARPLARVQEIEREYLPNMIFGAGDIVVAVGRDGLVANAMKYLDGQPLLGVNPDPARFDGALLPFGAGDVGKVLRRVIAGRAESREVSMGRAETKDGQVLYAVNDFFVGVSDHTSARYEIRVGGRSESQSSSGVIVSTGFGMTGWHKSVMAQFRGIARAFGLGEVEEPTADWGGRRLVFQVREPYPSRRTQAEIVFGEVGEGDSLVLVSSMGGNGVVFSDGILGDALEFNAGAEVRISVAERVGRLITG